jgi:hypothetical protein
LRYGAALSNGYQGLFPLGCEADHSPPINAEVKKLQQTALVIEGPGMTIEIDEISS